MATDPIGTSSQPSNFVHGGLPQGADHSNYAPRPTNAALAGDSLSHSGRDALRTGRNLIASAGYGTATLANKVKASLESHSTALSADTQPKRYAAAQKTAKFFGYLSKKSEAGAKKIVQFSTPKSAPLPKR